MHKIHTIITMVIKAEFALRLNQYATKNFIF